jgi:hypothetical protein
MRPDTLRWEAHYNDGTVLPQERAEGGENRYADIDRDRLASLVLVRPDGTAALSLHLDAGQRLIFRRRVEQQAGGAEQIVYLVGWQQTINGTNVQSIAYLTATGETHLAGRWREDHPWFYPAQAVPCETEQ